MNGVNSRTGKRLSGVAHLRQSVRDILTTPVGSRVLIRDYGSELFSFHRIQVCLQTVQILHLQIFQLAMLPFSMQTK